MEVTLTVRGRRASGKRVGGHVSCHWLNSFIERHRTKGERWKKIAAQLLLCESPLGSRREKREKERGKRKVQWRVC